MKVTLIIILFIEDKRTCDLMSLSLGGLNVRSFDLTSEAIIMIKIGWIGPLDKRNLGSGFWISLYNRDLG